MVVVFMTKLKVYSDETKTTVIERFTTKSRAEFITMANNLKEKYKEFHAGFVPVWAQIGNTIIADATLANVFETARLMQKGIL